MKVCEYIYTYINICIQTIYLSFTERNNEDRLFEENTFFFAR